jgi:hypothetical protein
MEDFGVVNPSPSSLLSVLCHFWSYFWVIRVRCFRGNFLQISLRGLLVSALCLFVDDIDPSNTGNHLRFVFFQRGSRWLLLSARCTFPVDWSGLRP